MHIKEIRQRIIHLQVDIIKINNSAVYGNKELSKKKGLLEDYIKAGHKMLWVLGDIPKLVQ